MTKLILAALSTAALFALSPTVPAYAAVVITQAKAIAGNVTPGDTPGFPVTLSLPGSYLLGSNLAVPANTDGVSITAHDVTLDLGGFRIYGSGVANKGIVGNKYHRYKQHYHQERDDCAFQERRHPSNG